ncbi:hypothetical protein S349_19 [Shewanella sp. phage 3/49]|uniref:hypothetical protein n=1 Tax=Shewanella sp. phage 3/49 TaxID=1458863 RepID=UPI0004F762B4|nr:hypothetical protein S349_19 [Shewanella sp. phage 3/49]AHK11809.1 hypothetical protein S349_19 [Shewanella sp. phage 3/49]
MKNADMPSMPVMDESDIHGQHYGLTKREHFAAMAMQGLCSHSGDYHLAEDIAYDAVMYADALLKELENTK